MKHFIILLILSLGLLTNTHAQSSKYNDISRGEMLKVDGKHTFNAILYTYSGPARWKKKDWLLAGGVVLGTLGTILIEEDLQPHFYKFRKDVPKTIRDIGFYFGKPQYHYGLTASLFAYGLLTKNKKIRKTAVLFIASATSAGLLQTANKNIFGRARPSTGTGNLDFDLFNGTPDYHSFPSGHTMLAFTTAHALAKQTKNPWLKAGIYSVGMITPVSRLWENAHWLSDVALSLALSVIVVDSAYNYLGLNAKDDYTLAYKRNKIKWNLRPSLNGVGLVGRF